MGCDIHSYAERLTNDGFVCIPDVGNFESQCYLTFGFFANVRNYSAITPISEPKGFPVDASDYVKERYEAWGGDAHTPSFLYLCELLDFNYDQEAEDRRVIIDYDGSCTCEPGKGKKSTYRALLGIYYFEWLNTLKEHKADRVVFWFDC